VHAWEPSRRPDVWPDADMLPIGKVELRDSFGQELPMHGAGLYRITPSR